MNRTIIIIGGGNMGGAIAARWRDAQGDGTPVGDIHVVETNAEKRSALSGKGITWHATLAEAPKGDVILLAIKPQQFAEYRAELSRVIAGTNPLLLSIMAGIPLAELTAITPRAVRVMPNLPAIIGHSMSILYAPDLDTISRETTMDLLRRIGPVAWVEKEELFHAVTAISGSGPAYLFALMEAMEKAAIAQGLPKELARLLVKKTMLGSALLADDAPEDATALRKRVTSKGGTTEAALEVFTKGGLDELVNQAVDAAAKRSKELAKA